MSLAICSVIQFSRGALDFPISKIIRNRRRRTRLILIDGSGIAFAKPMAAGKQQTLQPFPDPQRELPHRF
jgi:hypothetical protein